MLTPSAVRQIANPLADEFDRLTATQPDEFDGELYFAAWLARRELVKTYSWAIPSERAVSRLVELSPLLEVGAGAGYWASLITQAGGDILAVDEAPVGSGVENMWLDGTSWHPVEVGGVETIALHPERTLFLCWPPYESPMALECLRAYRGDTFAYVGEPHGGCTGDDAFFDELTRAWCVVEEIELPTWPDIHDSFTIFRRGN